MYPATGKPSSAAGAVSTWSVARVPLPLGMGVKRPLPLVWYTACALKAHQKRLPERIQANSLVCFVQLRLHGREPEYTTPCHPALNPGYAGKPPALAVG